MDIARRPIHKSPPPRLALTPAAGSTVVDKPAAAVYIPGMPNNEVSVSPSGESFPIPRVEQAAAELARLDALVRESRGAGREIVVVQGVGFVGAVMAAVVADSVGEDGQPGKFVIAMQRASPRSYWKIPVLNRGVSPIKAEDPEVERIVRRCVLEKKTLVATHLEEALGFADVVVVDVQCDYRKNGLGNVRDGEADMNALEESFHRIAEHIQPGTLVLIETTVPPGTTEQIAYPIMKKIFTRRGIASDPLLAHSYERVMPGRHYVASVRDFWRVASGVNPEARERVVKFLSEVLNTKDYPLTVLDRPIESETAKIVENSYRAAILAFMDEWSLFAERNGVDLKKVIEAIKVRPTHSNILFPGPGIGGYCLPKDGGLGVWANRHILGWEDDYFKATPQAIDINDTRALHVPQLVRDALRNMGVPIAAADILILGASYREDVGDTRYSGVELIVRRLTEMGASIRVHDPYVESWPELAGEETSEDVHGYGRLFSRQETLRRLGIEKDMWAAMPGIRALVLAVRHKDYLALDPEAVFEAVGQPFVVIDCFCILDDARIERYFELGCEVKGMGRGHIQRIKEKVRIRRR
jgi:UDP-N-acetyl-D-glucosamine dehydrogenase